MPGVQYAKLSYGLLVTVLLVLMVCGPLPIAPAGTVTVTLLTVALFPGVPPPW